MIEITILAPSAKNRQPWKFKIITDKSIITQISEFVCFSKWIQNVPCQILVFLDPRGEYPIGQEQSEVKVKPIFCFVIHSDYQRMGVATRLVQRICTDAAKEGFDYVEAYVHENFISTIDDFRGPRKLYEKCGFEMTACVNGKAVMRKKLK